MSNWVTLPNGVHIDLDDPNNPLTGDGTFESYLGGGKGGKSGDTFDNDLESAFKKYQGNFHPENDILDELRANGKDYGMSNGDMQAVVEAYVMREEAKYEKKIKAGPQTQEALNKDVSKWLNANTDLIKYEDGPGGRGVNGKVISDLKQQYLKDVLGIEVDSYLYDYDSGFSMSRAKNIALDDVWRNEKSSNTKTMMQISPSVSKSFIQAKADKLGIDVEINRVGAEWRVVADDTSKLDSLIDELDEDGVLMKYPKRKK